MTFERSHDLKKSLYFKRVIENKANIMNKAIINKANFPGIIKFIITLSTGKVLLGK